MRIIMSQSFQKVADTGIPMPEGSTPFTPQVSVPSERPARESRHPMTDDEAALGPGENLQQVITDAISETLEGHCETENQGIGEGEQFGTPFNDAGTDFPVLRSYRLAVDVTDWEGEMESVSGSTPVFLSGSSLQQDVSWTATPKHRRDHNGRRYVIFEVSEPEA